MVANCAVKSYRGYMIDLRRILGGLTQAIETEAPDAAILASALGLDVSQARITKTKSLLAVHDARLMPNNILADIVWGEMPYREIWLLIANSSLPYRDVRDEVLGVNQRTQPSKLSPGFAVLFEIGGWTCGYTVDSPDADVSAVFCEAQESRQRRLENRGSIWRNVRTAPLNLDAGAIKPD